MSRIDKRVWFYVLLLIAAAVSPVFGYPAYLSDWRFWGGMVALALYDRVDDIAHKLDIIAAAKVGK